MKRVFILILIFASCKKSAFVCYICKTTVVDSGKYTILPDYQKCNVDKSIIDSYQLKHNNLDTQVLCNKF